MAGEFARSLMDVLAVTKTLVYGQTTEMGGPMIADHRNNIVRRFLGTEAEWLWMVDSDMVFESDVLDRLMASAHWKNRPIVGALCFGANRRSTKIFPTMYWWKEDGELLRADRTNIDFRSAGMVEVDATGSACTLIHRSVLEKICEKHPYPKGPYAFAWDGDERVGEDVNFCIRARVEGFPIWVDCDIRVGHVKPVILDLDYYELFVAWQEQERLAAEGGDECESEKMLSETSATS